MLRYALALAATAAFAVPAFAADPATLDCVEKTVTPAARDGLAADMRRNLSQADQSQSYSPEVVGAIRAAAEACRVKHGWSAAASQAALLHAVPVLGWPTAVNMARAAKLNDQALLKRFMALPENERVDALNETVLGKLAREAFEAKEITAENAKLAGGMFGLLALREKARNEFRNN